jgi:hypothetical protein
VEGGTSSLLPRFFCYTPLFARLVLSTYVAVPIFLNTRSHVIVTHFCFVFNQAVVFVVDASGSEAAMKEAGEALYGVRVVIFDLTTLFALDCSAYC